jgi:hypothetical protein
VVNIFASNEDAVCLVEEKCCHSTKLSGRSFFFDQFPCNGFLFVLVVVCSFVQRCLQMSRNTGNSAVVRVHLFHPHRG